MVGGEGSDAEVFADGVEFTGDEGDEGVGGLLAFDFAESPQDVVDGAGEVHGEKDCSRFEALEEALGEVIGDTGDVVHVAVGEAEEVGGEGELGGSADVEADAEFGDLDDGFLAGDGVAEDGILPETESCKALLEIGALDRRRCGGLRGWRRSFGVIFGHGEGR